MTVEWLMRIFSSGNNDNNNNNININNPPPIDHNFLTNTKSVPTPESPARPILSGGTNNHNFFPTDYTGSDFKERQASQLPILSPDYPAFFILILLVTLTSFALFILLFLCCLDGKELGDEEQGNIPIPISDDPEPLVKDVGTETDPPDSDSSSPPTDTDSLPAEEDVIDIQNDIPESPDKENVEKVAEVTAS